MQQPITSDDAGPAAKAIADATDGAWPSPMRAWVTVMVLVAAYATAFVDRQILTLLVEPVRRDLAITDTEFSLLSGLAFTLFYTVMGIPLAWVADRGSRRKLIIASIAVWSLMTAACGLASSFLTLFLARIGVGVGEAGLSPAAYSMIADSFPANRRARALGVYAMGSIAGVGLALLIGGAVVQWALTAPPASLPLIGTLHSWQLAFFVVSLPGPLLMLAMALTREPHRQTGAAPAEDKAPFGPFLRRRGRVFALLAAGYSFIGIAVAAYLTWTPAFLIRVHDWPVGQVGAVLGCILLTFSTGGILLGGWWADTMALAGRRDAVLRVAIIGASLAVPFAVAAPFAPSGTTAAALLAAMFLAFGLTQGLPAVSFQAIAPNRLRARVMALYLLIGNIVAFTIGPTGVALISDHVLKDPDKIGVAVAIVSGIMVPLGLACLIAARRGYVQAAAEVEAAA
ncbi:MAG: MFS transporter [Alphaproteobacteria bacterium]|nr:MFS transporter [Alphaproteobacteria bacterium]MBU1512504.1 MFS transporter [Alphaproteobacteria bacterium]MBU2096572.1 MFS transporter [Alphaproteobacteria bacterium]MBU2151610.1 MFS transporter [Alphaproteobacteria bacterium]MBU2307328.1 MFS transporter [Alphaproteobacteria bacterium]